jgi:hypothetical protein
MSDGADPRHYADFYQFRWVRVITEHDPNCVHLWEFAMKYREMEKCGRCGGFKLWKAESEFDSATMEKVDEL